MSGDGLTYAVVTPARNEAENLRRLAEALRAQTVVPTSWVVVVNGSTDSTGDEARELAAETDWIHVTEATTSRELARGGTVVRALTSGLAALPSTPDVLVKLDADVSFEAEYFERLLEAFAADPRLGISSGTAYEYQDGAWRQRHMTSGSVWGASRAYRWACLQDVLPLEERMGWDGIDALKANLLGWETRLLPELPFRHHRSEGERDGRRSRAWAAQGRAAHYMGYRLSYLVLRSARYSMSDPAALAMVAGYLRAAATRAPRCPDRSVLEALRERQRIRDLPWRVRESFGRAAGRAAG